MWLHLVQIASKVFESGINGYRDDRMTRAKFLCDLECSYHIEARRSPRENALFLCQTPGHVAGFSFINSSGFIVASLVEQWGNKPDANPLDMMRSCLAG